MADHLTDKVVVVTGAGSGFGRLLTEGLAVRGSHVIAGDVDADGLAETVDSAAGGPGTVDSAACDVIDAAQVQALVDLAVERHGRIDVLVNNAGIMPLAFFRDHARAAEAWDRCIDVNLKGVLHGIVAAHDHMLAQGRGHIVNLASIYANAPVVGAAVYGATKAAVAWLSEALRQESQGKIKVTTIRPTGVPATNLGTGVINLEAVAGILGTALPEVMAQSAAMAEGTADPALTDAETIAYASLAPELLVEQIIHVIDQPWGVAISDITVRASGDRYLL
ncbi:MAG: SDR family NAD(P)-dependent oxidoreductase [Actinomycetota bacterium]